MMMTITWWLAAIPDCLRVSCLLRQWWGVTKQTNNYPQGRNNHPLMMTAYDDENGDGRWWWPLEREKKRRGDLSLGLALHIGLWRKSPPHKSNLVSVFVLTLGAVASKEKGGGPRLQVHDIAGVTNSMSCDPGVWRNEKQPDVRVSCAGHPG